MKRSLVVLACALTLVQVSPSFALMSYQESQAGSQAQGAPPSPEQVVAMMSKQLNLTDDQKAQITPIIAERQQQMAALKANPPGRKMKGAREAKSIMSDSDKKIEAVLTPDQKTKYEQMKEEMKEKAKEKKSGGV